MNKKELTIQVEAINKAYDLATKLRKYMDYYGFSTSVIEVVFLKYLCDFNDVENPEEFKTFMKYKNMFIDEIYSLDVALEAFKIIEKKYNIQGNILSSAAYALEELLVTQMEEIFDILNSFELPQDNKIKSLFFRYLIEYSDSDIKRSAYYYSNTCICKLCKEILNVKENETYLDSFCGFNKNAFDIEASNYFGYEINRDVAACSIMIMIMLDRKKINIKNEDFFMSETNKIADKVFSDNNPGMKFTTIEAKRLGYNNKNNEFHDIKKSIQALKENGVAVITCTSKVLMNNSFLKLRKELTNEKLKTVIALPPLWNGTSINTNLLVFEDNYKSDNVIMIDASNKDYITNIGMDKNVLNDDIFKKIINSLNGEIIDGFSKNVNVTEILSNEICSWQPQNYIGKRLDKKFRSSIIIKDELNKTYEELMNLFK